MVTFSITRKFSRDFKKMFQKVNNNNKYLHEKKKR